MKKVFSNNLLNKELKSFNFVLQSNKYKNSVLFSNLALKFFSGQLPRHKKLALPSLSPSMDKGGIAQWLKKEGEHFQSGDVIAGIETDKATVDFEVNEEGYIAKILKPQGAKDIPLGDIIAITVENKEDIAAFKDYVETGAGAAQTNQAEAPKQQQTQAQPQSTQSQSSVKLPRHKKVTLPNLSPSMETVRINYFLFIIFN